jgi:GDP-L-fucose synthase
MNMRRDSKVYVAGHTGLVGSALLRGLHAAGYGNVVTCTHGALDLTQARAVDAFFAAERPEYVILAAAKVGGIMANQTYPVDFLAQNLAIQHAVIEAASRHGVRRLLFLGSSCIYPKFCPQPIREEYLLTGSLEPTNRAYAIAKIAGIELCWAYNRQYGTRYLAVMPSNLYGPNDNYHATNSHVLPALVRRAVESVASGAEEMVLWGTGIPRREFLYADDLASACLMLLESEDAVIDPLFSDECAPLINVGSGTDISIRELAELIAAEAGFRGKISLDPTKPDGTPQKLLDVTRIRDLGWEPRVSLEEGVRRCIATVRASAGSFLREN